MAVSRAPVFTVEEKVRVVLPILAGEVSVSRGIRPRARRSAARLPSPLPALRACVGGGAYAARLARAPLSVGALDRLRSGCPG